MARETHHTRKSKILAKPPESIAHDAEAKRDHTHTHALTHARKIYIPAGTFTTIVASVQGRAASSAAVRPVTPRSTSTE